MWQAACFTHLALHIPWQLIPEIVERAALGNPARDLPPRGLRRAGSCLQALPRGSQQDLEAPMTRGCGMAV